MTKSVVLEEKLLSSIEPARFMQRCQWSFHNTWSGDVDVSAWLRANGGRGSRFYLFVVYRDQHERRVVTVDRCIATSSDSHLLNGRINLTGKGALTSIQIKLKVGGCKASNVMVEETSFVPRNGVSGAIHGRTAEPV